MCLWFLYLLSLSYTASASLRARDDLFCDKDNGTCEVESTTSRSNGSRNRTDDDCDKINKNLRKSSNNKSGCKVNAKGKRTAQQNASGGNTSGNRENEDGLCKKNANCE